MKFLSITTRLWSIAGAVLLGLFTFAFFAYSTINDVKINGKLYQEIVLTKDLVADILPPHLNILLKHVS